MSMKNTMKTLVRSPIRTLLTILLLAAATFAFVSRVSEAYITNRELDRASAEYRSIGWLTGNSIVENNYTVIPPVTNEQLDIVRQSEYVELVNTVRVASGVTDKLIPEAQQLEKSGYLYIEATVAGKTYVRGYNGEELKIFFSFANDDRIVAGDPVYLRAATGLQLSYFTANLTMRGEYQPAGTDYVGRTGEGIPQEFMDAYDAVQTGDRYFFKVSANISFWAGLQTTTYKIQPLDGTDILLYKLEAELDLTQPDLRETSESIEILNYNNHATSLLAVDDMQTLPIAVKDMTIADGRFLSREADDGNDVCVVSSIYADEYGYKVGDTIEMRVDNIHSNNAAGIVEEYSDLDCESIQKTLTIVGIYNWAKSADSIFWIPMASVFVPQSALPDNWTRDEFYPAYCGFVLKSPTLEADFLATAAQDNVTISTLDSGWDGVSTAFGDMRRSSSQNAMIMSVSAAAAILLVVFLFISRKRKDCAIMRALGVSKTRAGATLCSSFAVLSVVGVAGGGVGAYYAAQSAILKSFADVSAVMQADFIFDTVLPIWFVAVMAVVTLTAAMVTVVVGAILQSRSSPLALLQGGTVRRKGRSETVAESKFTYSGMHVTAAVPEANSTAFAQIVRYILRHIHRSAVKSIITFFVAALFIFSLGMIQSIIGANRQTVEDMYNTTEVSGYLAMRENSSYRDMGIPVFGVKQVIETGYVKSMYLQAYGEIGFSYGEYDEEQAEAMIAEEAEASGETETTKSSVSYIMSIGSGRNYKMRYFSGHADATLLAVTDIARHLELVESDAAVTYLDGCNSDMFSGKERLCVVSYDLAESLGLRLGDAINAQLYGREAVYAGDNVWSTGSGVSIPMDFIIAGFIVGGADNTVYIPAEIVYDNTYNVRYSVAEFTLDTLLNRDLNPFRDRINFVFEGAVSPGLKAIIFRLDDSELTQVVEGIEQNTKVLENVFPIVLAVAVLIAAALSGLIVMQRSMEASMLRVLGATKRRTRTILAAEQVLLCIIGLCIGVLALYLYNGATLRDVSSTLTLCVLLYLAGCVIGTVFAAITVTRRNVLELLQTKE